MEGLNRFFPKTGFDMEKFKEGVVVYHKATKKRCVVIKINSDEKTIKVRTETDEEKDYYPQELETEQEVDERNNNEVLKFS